MIRAIIWKELREQGLIALTLVLLGGDFARGRLGFRGPALSECAAYRYHSLPGCWPARHSHARGHRRDGLWRGGFRGGARGRDVLVSRLITRLSVANLARQAHRRARTGSGTDRSACRSRSGTEYGLIARSRPGCHALCPSRLRVGRVRLDYGSNNARLGRYRDSRRIADGVLCDDSGHGPLPDPRHERAEARWRDPLCRLYVSGAARSFGVAVHEPRSNPRLGWC